MLADLHAHYPMHVVPNLTPYDTVKGMRKLSNSPTFGDKVRALILRIATVLFSNRNWWSGYRISVEGLRAGNVGLALSVLTRPQEEFDPKHRFMSPPVPSYFSKLIQDLERVEAEVCHQQDPAVIRLVHNRTELDECLRADATALVHCVEGGFSLGAEEKEIEKNVAELSNRGVAYVTLAHLFFRQVATNAPALPFLRDDFYNRLFPQRAGDGLTKLGIAAVRAMFHHRVLVDVSHMRTDAIKETFELLNKLDPGREMPVVATHSGYRFGKQIYMLDTDTITEIKDRDGVVGLIMAQHQLNDGVRCDPTETFEDSLAVIYRHIDKIAEVTGDYRHVAFGTDFDGFIKPTMSGLESAADLCKLERALERKYKDDAKLITSGNALRVLRKLWPK